MRHFGIAGLQLQTTGENSLEHIATEVATVKRRFPWIDMVVLPELCTYGPRIDHAEPPGGPAEQAFCQLARKQAIWLVPGSLFQTQGTRVYNTALAINPDGEVVARYRKIYPFRPYEQGVSAGDGFCVFAIPDVGKFGLCICYDVWFPEIARTLAWMGAEVVLCPTLTNTIDRDVEVAMARAAAASNQCYFISINAASPSGMGRSVACGPGGEILHEAAAAQEIIALDLDLDQIDYTRRHGWNGLGQVLKSFRDTPVVYPPYQGGAQSAALESLGPLAKMTRLQAPAAGAVPAKQRTND
jgi:deaminated glutathione amidase